MNDNNEKITKEWIEQFLGKERIKTIFLIDEEYIKSHKDDELGGIVYTAYNNDNKFIKNPSYLDNDSNWKKVAKYLKDEKITSQNPLQLNEKGKIETVIDTKIAGIKPEQPKEPEKPKTSTEPKKIEAVPEVKNKTSDNGNNDKPKGMSKTTFTLIIIGVIAVVGIASYFIWNNFNKKEKKENDEYDE